MLGAERLALAAKLGSTYAGPAAGKRPWAEGALLGHQVHCISGRQFR
jgi:hypothetical protein